jgi:hypothetical protein
MKQDDTMDQAYRVAGRAVRARLRAERPADARELDGVAPAEVAVVTGQYDHIERVLEATAVPFTRVAADRADSLDWDRLQVLLVSCPGMIERGARERIAPWVRRGGYLLTTDWALKHLVEPVFPGLLRHNGVQTADTVVRVEGGASADDPLISGFLEAEREPLWWLESASYPIEVLDSARVRVLIRSGEVARSWGADPVVVTFDEGHGTVVHMLSHLYLQRSDVRTTRDAQPAAAYMAEAGYSAEEVDFCEAAAPALRASELVSAASTSRLISDVVLQQRRRARGGSR